MLITCPFGQVRAVEHSIRFSSQFHEFAGLDGAMTRLPDETTILRFGHRLEAYGVAAQIVVVVNEILAEGLLPKADSAVDATLIVRPVRPRTARFTRLGDAADRETIWL